MRKFIVLSRYHIRKNKGQYLSLSLIVLIAAMVFGLGLVTILNSGEMFQEKFKQYECADVFYTLYDSDWTDTISEKAQEIKGVTATEIRKNVMLSGEAFYGETGNSLNHIFFNMDDKHVMNKIEAIGDTLDRKDVKHPIYISYWVKANGCKIGDTYKFLSGKTTYEFTIAGFVEDLMYGNNNCGSMGVYLPEKEFNAMYESVEPNCHAKTLALRLANNEDGKEVYTELTKMTAGNLANNYTFNYGYLKMCQTNRTAVANIMSAMLMAFSALLVIITMFVINFRIKSSIHEEMQNMGVLTSIGYTSRQVIWSVAIPYVMIGIISIMIGLIGTYLLLPMIQELFGKLSGLLWMTPLDFVLLSLVILVIMGLILFTTLFSARKIKKLHPIDALKSGIKHHSFKKNYFPLHKTKTNLNITFGLKGFISSIKQSIFLFLILTFSSLTTIYMASAMYNSIVEPINLINIVSEEYPTVSFTGHNHNDAESIRTDIEQDTRVENTLYYDTSNAIIGEETVVVFVINEYKKLQNNIIYSGRYPKHDNEIAIGSAIADRLDVGIGDRIKIKSVDNSQEYYIVGLLQAPSYGSSACEMTSEGFRRLNIDFEQTTLYVYLKNVKEADTYTEDMVKKHKDKLAGYTNMQSMIEEVYDNFIPLMIMVIYLVCVLMVALIIVVLYMMIRTLISHRKQELGICKALGYTTKQLVQQLSYSLLPAITLGTILGGTLGYLLVNQIWLLFLGGVGLQKVYLPVPILWAVVIIIILILFSTLMSVLLARRIKRISPIELIRE